MNQQQDDMAIKIFEAGKSQSFQAEVSGIPVLVIPKDMKVESMDSLIDSRADRPFRLRQAVVAQDCASFLSYLNRFGDENTTVFVDLQKTRFVGVIDYHESMTGQRHCLHTITYDCPLTKEWGSWLSKNNEKMDQEQFSYFIEDNINEIIFPNGAEMLEIAQTLKAKIDVDFRSSKLIDNGQTQILYKETIDGQAGINGELTIPNEIELAIRPFQNGTPYKMVAKFRYRIKGGQLCFWYTLVRPHLCIEDAAKEVLEEVRTGLTVSDHVILGTTHI